MSEDFHKLQEDRTVWDVTQVKDPTAQPRRLKVCKSCQSIMASPNKLRDLKNKYVRMCSGSKDDLSCSLKAIALASIDIFNRELLTGSVEYQTRLAQGSLWQGTLALVGGVRGKGRAWHDIDTLELRVYRYDIAIASRY